MNGKSQTMLLHLMCSVALLGDTLFRTAVTLAENTLVPIGLIFLPVTKASKILTLLVIFSSIFPTIAYQLNFNMFIQSNYLQQPLQH